MRSPRSLLRRPEWGCTAVPQHVVVASDNLPEGHDFIAGRLECGRQVMIVRSDLAEFASAIWEAARALEPVAPVVQLSHRSRPSCHCADEGCTGVTPSTPAAGGNLYVVNLKKDQLRVSAAG